MASLKSVTEAYNKEGEVIPAARVQKSQGIASREIGEFWETHPGRHLIDGVRGEKEKAPSYHPQHARATSCGQRPETRGEFSFLSFRVPHDRRGYRIESRLNHAEECENCDSSKLMIVRLKAPLQFPSRWDRALGNNTWTLGGHPSGSNSLFSTVRFACIPGEAGLRPPRQPGNARSRGDWWRCERWAE